MRSLFLNFAFFCGVIFFVPAQETLEKGIVHDSLTVSGTNNETFALYLPKSYQENTLSSIIFIFEPAARGSIGIQPFISASEKYGHILVCSNDSRNGPYERNFDIANNLFTHIFSLFKIQEDEMYLSGFSGGSRLASAIASLTNKFAGVVGCGAGFSYLQEQMPAAQHYAYVGLCGTKDMNYKEMLENKGYLKLIKFNSTLITYDGNHSWPPKKQVLRAFDWLHLQKLKKNGLAKDEAILEQYQSEYNQIQKFKDSLDFLFAAEEYERLIKSYAGVYETDSLAKQLQQLKASKPFKKQTASLTNALKLEKKLSSKLIAQMSSDFENPEKTNFSWWEKELRKVNALAEKQDKEINKMVYRIKFDLFARAYSRKNSLLYSNNKDQVKLIDQFLDIIYPKKE